MRMHKLSALAGTIAIFVIPAVADAQGTLPPGTGATEPAAASATTTPATPPPVPAATPGPTPSPVPAPIAPQPTMPADATAPRTLVGSSGPEWSHAYLAARERMVAGDFATAGLAFQNLAATARHPFDQGLALELARLCQTWQQRGLVFVQKQDLGESSFRARAADERTADEIASLYLTSVVYGLGTGAWLAVQTEPESAAGGILPSLVLAGAAAGGVALLDSGRPMRYGVPQSIVTGLGLGFYEGLLFTMWNQARTNHEDEWEGTTMAMVIWGSATVGALTGGVVGNLKGTTPGRASFVGSVAMWSAAVSGLTVGAFSQDDNMQDDKALLAAAVGLNAGAVGGMFAAGPLSPSIARVRYLDLGGFAGGLVFSGLYISAADNESEASAFMATAAAGITTGLIASWIFTNGMEPDRGARERSASAAPALELRPTLVPVRDGMGIGLQGTL